MRRFLSTLAVAALVLLVARPADAVKFRFPLDDPEGLNIVPYLVLHCDHEPGDHTGYAVDCLAFDCQEGFPSCYDEHRGTDYPLMGGFETMDLGSLAIVAAADGEVIEAVDGNYDRCHGDLGSEVTCDGYPMQANRVALRHADGTVSEYYHMKKGSVLVTVGQQVTCGQPLGLIGSSGISAMPHLHFQVEKADGSGWVDPYAGPCSQAGSYWVLQDTPYGIPWVGCEGEPLPEFPPEPGPEPVPEPVAEAAPEPLPEPIVEPVPEPAAEPASDLATADEPATPDTAPADLASADPGAPDVPAQTDPGRTGFFASGPGCAAGGTAGGAPLALLLLPLLGLARRRPRDPS